MFGEATTPTVIMARFFDVCFPGFTPGEPVSVSVRFPNGTTQTYAAKDFSETGPGGAAIAYLFWYTVPGQPLGRYDITATQGGLEATGAFVLKPAIEERLQIVPLDGFASGGQLEAKRGTSIPIALAGFRADESAVLNLYHDGRYLTAVDVTVDPSGQALYQFATTPNDPVGSYCVVLSSAPEPGCGWFGNMFGLTA